MTRFTRYVFQCDKCKQEVPTSATDWVRGTPTLPGDWTPIGPHHLCPRCLVLMQEDWLFFPKLTTLLDALREIESGGCSNFTGPPFACFANGRTLSEYTAERACDPCIVHRALHEELNG